MRTILYPRISGEAESGFNDCDVAESENGNSIIRSSLSENTQIPNFVKCCTNAFREAPGLNFTIATLSNLVFRMISGNSDNYKKSIANVNDLHREPFVQNKVTRMNIREWGMRNGE